MSRPRLGLLAAGGVAGIVVAQLWGLGLDVARAADDGSATGPAVAQLTGDGDLLGTALPTGGTALPVGATAPPTGGAALPAGTTALPTGATAPPIGGIDGIDGLVRDRIRDGGFPLPSQASALPDAFAIAAGLLPPAPARPGSPRDPVVDAAPEPATPAAGTTAPWPPRPGPAAPQSGTAGRADDGGAGPSARPGSVPASRPSQQATELAGADGSAAGVAVADGGSAPGIEQTSPSRAAIRGTRRAVNWLPAQQDAPATAQPNGDQPAIPQGSEPYLADRVERAVLIPIAAGLLLTGAAMYKHRGLPRGHGQ
ncbi:hypothetical protein E6W39_27540 [Kitasatospora acidiphila]|uniref:Uncharacterized protein n=1 Tax=Kitasatospora acidiphila TaxID=2567942 RepID=A0A540W8F7_9ACTN|nr:hypothetical protein [Kitasatospora acidiphila]TQF05303.1 hypothetical protein E6W39_27540 [Kitasatospora acidiphila]